MPSMHTRKVARPSAQGANCTIQRRNGGFCDAPTAPDMPFPICAQHAIEIYRHLQQVIDAAGSSTRRKAELTAAFLSEIRGESQEPDGTIYYVLVGDMIKIGYTTALNNRVASYPPGTTLLAREPGGKGHEQMRHSQFAAYRTARKEWYRIEQPIVDHINTLRRKNGRKPLALTDLRSQAIM